MKDFENYVSGISFRFLQPEKKASRFYRKVAKRLQKWNIYLDVINTKLPYEERETRKILKPTERIERMSTFAIGAIINKAVSLMPGEQAFVNIGVWKGYTFLTGVINNSNKTCVGVDNFSEFMRPKDSFLKEFQRLKSGHHYFYEMDYKQYFEKKHSQPIGFYIYDGAHDYENQLEGLKVAEDYFGDNCIIMVDDTNLKEAKQATLDFMNKSNNRYKIILDRSTSENMHPSFWNGIMILKKI